MCARRRSDPHFTSWWFSISFKSKAFYWIDVNKQVLCHHWASLLWPCFVVSVQEHMFTEKTKKSEFHAKTGFFQPERPHGQLWSADSLWAWLVFTKKVNLTRRIRKLTQQWEWLPCDHLLYIALDHISVFLPKWLESALSGIKRVWSFFLSCSLKLIQRSIPFDPLSYFNSTVSYPHMHTAIIWLPACTYGHDVT